MSIRPMSLVLDFAPDHWSPSTRMVAIALADRVGTDWTCWPSIADIAQRAGMSRRQAIRHLRILEGEGIIASQEQRRPNGSRKSNLWIWLWITHTDTPLQGDTGDTPQGDTGDTMLPHDKVTLVTPLEPS